MVNSAKFLGYLPVIYDSKIDPIGNDVSEGMKTAVLGKICSKKREICCKKIILTRNT
jgi:hypothetical protein